MRARVLLQVLVERKRQPNQISDQILHLIALLAGCSVIKKNVLE